MRDRHVKLIYTNYRGESIEFTHSFPLFLQKITGLDSVNMEYSSSKSINQDGVTLNDGTMGTRPVTIFGVIKGENKKHLAYLRNKMLRVFTPKSVGKLRYEYEDMAKEIECKVECGPKFNNNKVWTVQNFVIDLICEDPYLKDVFIVGEKISTWIGGLRFKFTLPFRLKQKGEPRKNIYNEGHVSAPIEVFFKGPAVNPCITNVSTGEFIKVNRTLTSDDILYINTDYMNTVIEIERNGIKKNAIDYIDIDSSFFYLDVGDNLIEYSTENNMDPQLVELRYKNRYLGV